MPRIRAKSKVYTRPYVPTMHWMRNSVVTTPSPMPYAAYPPITPSQYYPAQVISAPLPVPEPIPSSGYVARQRFLNRTKYRPDDKSPGFVSSYELMKKQHSQKKEPTLRQKIKKRRASTQAENRDSDLASS